VLPKVMVFDSNMLCPRCEFWIVSHSNTRLIILPDLQDKFRLRQIERKDNIHFSHKIRHWDGSKEQCLGDFKRKLHEADCHLRQTKPYSPWQQATEGCIRELKRGVSRKMIKTGSPRTLWDHCIELEALIRSSTCNDIYMTNSEVPETIMTGSTADISHICEFGWYDWVMFWDNVPSFPDNKLVLGRYLGPATDVGSALTAKILKSNGQTVCRSTLRHLNDEELHCPIQKELHRSFDESMTHHLVLVSFDKDYD